MASYLAPTTVGNTRCSSQYQIALDKAESWEKLLRQTKEHVELHMYTDGSANAAKKTSGYAVIILVKLGIALPHLESSTDRTGVTHICPGHWTKPWPLGPSKLRLQQASFGWCRHKPFFRRLRVKMFYDCMAAGRAAGGQWTAPNALGDKTHDLELYLRGQCNIDLELCHVKGPHSADYIRENQVHTYIL